MLIGYVGFLSLLTSVLSNNHTFLEQPMSVLLPVGRMARITCRTHRDYGIQWIVLLQNPKATIITDIDGAVVILRKNGITVEGRSTPMSVITIQPSLPDNLIRLTCQAVQGQERLSSSIATVTYFGPPSPVANLTAIEVALATLRIIWSTNDIRPGIVVNFTFTMISLESQEIVEQLSGTKQERLVTAGNHPLCNLYRFEVLAANAAGTSKPSSIEHRFPSIPNITLLEQSLQQTLVKAEDGVTLTVKFRSDISCPDYPVLNYTLVLQEPNRMSLTFIEARRVTRDIVTVTAHLDSNARFQYSIIAANRAGSTNKSTPISIITTTVQSVFVCQVSNTSYYIQCTYLSGSIVRGCIYTLSSRLLGVENVTGMISRNNTQGAPVDPDIFVFFDTLLAIEWPFEHLVSERPIHVVGPSLTRSAPACTLISESSGFLVTAGITVAIGFSTIFIVTAVVAIFVGIRKPACHKKNEDKEMPTMENVRNHKMIKNVVKTAADVLQNQQNTIQNAVDNVLQSQQMEQFADTMVQQPKKKLEELVKNINKAITKQASEVYHEASEEIDTRPASSKDKVKPEISIKSEKSQSVKKGRVERPAKWEKEQPVKMEKAHKEDDIKREVRSREKRTTLSSRLENKNVYLDYGTSGEVYPDYSNRGEIYPDSGSYKTKSHKRFGRTDSQEVYYQEGRHASRETKHKVNKSRSDHSSNREKMPININKAITKQDSIYHEASEEIDTRPAFSKDKVKPEISIKNEKGQSIKKRRVMEKEHKEDDIKREVRSREKRTTLSSKLANKNMKKVYSDDGTSGENYPDYSNRGEIYPDDGSYKTESHKRFGGTNSQEVYYNQEGRHESRGGKYKVNKSQSDHSVNRKRTKLMPKTYSTSDCRVKVFDDFASEVSLPSNDRADKILSDLKERARHKRKEVTTIDDFATEVSLPANDVSEKILENLKKRALQIRRDRELKKANRRRTSLKQAKSSEYRQYS